MKIIHFNIYKRSHDINSSSIVTVHNEDKKALKKYCKKFKVTPYKVYVLFNYTRGYEDLVAYYLKHKSYKYHTFENSLELLTMWNFIVDGFNKGCFPSISKSIDNLKSVDLLLDLTPLKKDLNIIVNLFQIPFYEEGLFLQKSFEKKRKRANENCFSDYYSFRDKVNSLKNKTRVLNINSVVDDISSLLPHHLSRIEDKYFFISLYFYSVAKYYYNNQSYTVSFNMLHRMLDIYFEYLCKIDRLSPSRNYLWNKYQELSSARSSYSFNSLEEEIIKKLNQSRNKLYLTHGLYSLKKIELKKMLFDLKELINSKNGNMNWWNGLKKLEINYKIKPLNLFISEPSFETYFKDITGEFYRF